MIRSFLAITVAAVVTTTPIAWTFAWAKIPPVRARDEDLQALARWLAAYRRIEGRLPDDVHLASLAASSVDPWGRAYRFERHDGAIKFFTLGADGVPGGDGAAADLEHWVMTCESAYRPPDCRQCGVR